MFRRTPVNEEWRKTVVRARLCQRCDTPGKSISIGPVTLAISRLRNGHTRRIRTFDNPFEIGRSDCPRYQPRRASFTQPERFKRPGTGLLNVWRDDLQIHAWSEHEQSITRPASRMRSPGCALTPVNVSIVSMPSSRSVTANTRWSIGNSARSICGTSRLVVIQAASSATSTNNVDRRITREKQNIIWLLLQREHGCNFPDQYNIERPPDPEMPARSLSTLSTEARLRSDAQHTGETNGKQADGIGKAS